MRYYYDTEFLEDGKTVDLISIGIVSEDGREYYAVNSEMPLDRIKGHDWLVRNVLPSLPIRGRLALDAYINHSANSFPRPGLLAVDLDLRAAQVKPRQVIANEVRDFFLTDGDRPELWAWYAAYDHVALCQLWGTMMQLPSGMPMWTNDLRQECERLGNPQMPEQAEGQHNALADARHNRTMWEFLSEVERKAVA